MCSENLAASCLEVLSPSVFAATVERFLSGSGVTETKDIRKCVTRLANCDYYYDESVDAI